MPHIFNINRPVFYASVGINIELLEKQVLLCLCLQLKFQECSQSAKCLGVGKTCPGIHTSSKQNDYEQITEVQRFKASYRINYKSIFIWFFHCKFLIVMLK